MRSTSDVSLADPRFSCFLSAFPMLWKPRFYFYCFTGDLSLWVFECWRSPLASEVARWAFKNAKRICEE